MFNKKLFATTLLKIIDRYESISEFARVSDTGRSYISKYVNQKLEVPPSPKILKKISDVSKAIVSYEELMNICGYLKNIDNNKNNQINLEELEKYETKLNMLSLSEDELDIINNYINYLSTSTNVDSELYSPSNKSLASNFSKEIVFDNDRLRDGFYYLTMIKSISYQLNNTSNVKIDLTGLSESDIEYLQKQADYLRWRNNSNNN